jgi:hypothetical protein
MYKEQEEKDFNEGGKEDDCACYTSETSVNFYQTTRRSNPEESHLHTRRRDNLKYHQEERNDQKL